MGTIARMAVELGMDASGFEAGIAKVQQQTESMISKLGNVGKTMSAAVTLPLVGAAGAALKFSTDLNAGMANTASLGIAAERVEELKSNVQSMAVETGKSTSDLSDGLYQVVSAFGDTADTAKILEINAKASAAGLAETTDAINLTSAITKGYGDTSAEAVQHAADLALETVKLGQTTFPELAASMGRVVPLAASLGAEQEELFGVMATATGVTGNAAEVSTQLRGVLQSLMAPTEDMTSLINSMGYETGAAMLQQEGMQGTIKAIVAAAEASGTPLQKYIGSIEGQTLALALAGPQADVFGEKLAAMADVAGSTDAAFAAQTQGINATGFEMQQAAIKAETMAQKIGDGLAPALTIVLDTITPLIDQVGALVDWFAQADAGTQTWIVGAVGLVAALGPLLMILPTIAAGIGLILSPIGLVIAGLALLGAAWATNFGGIQEKTAAAWAAIQPVLTAMGDAINLVVSYLTATFETGDDRSAFGYIRKLPEFLQAPTLALGAFVVFAQTSLAGLGATLTAFFAPAIERVQTAFLGLPESLAPLMPALQEMGAAFGGLVQAVQPLVMVLGVALAVAADFGVNLMAAAIERLPGIIGPIIDQVTNTIKLISTVLTEVTTAIVAVANGDWATAWDSMKSIVTAFQTFISDTWTNITTMVGNIGGAVGDAVVNTLNDMGLTAAAMAVEDIIDQIKIMGDSISAVLSGDLAFSITLPDWLSKLLKWAWPALPAVPAWITTLLTWMWPSFPNVPNWVQTLFNWRWPGLPEAPTWLADLLNWKWPAMPSFSIPGLAVGGPVVAGNTYMVGERGPELFTPNRSGSIIPNDELGGIWGDLVGAGGEGTQVVVTANVASSIDVHALAYQVAAEIDRWRRR